MTRVGCELQATPDSHMVTGLRQAMLFAKPTPLLTHTAPFDVAQGLEDAIGVSVTHPTWQVGYRAGQPLQCRQGTVRLCCAWYTVWVCAVGQCVAHGVGLCCGFVRGTRCGLVLCVST